ncbi:MAG: LysM domain-containing protein [Planctomycetota bacterium]
MSPAAPTYLTAESAPPPLQAPPGAVTPDALAPGNAIDRPDRFATLSTTPPFTPAAMPPDTLTPPPSTAQVSSAAFATAWADAHEKLGAGRYAEALAALSVWYDDPSLGLEESQRLEDLLGQLAGTVVYSQQDLLLPPHVVAAGETLPLIAAPLGVSWQLLGKINGIVEPQRLTAGEHVKVIRGPFDAVVSVSRRRLSLQLGGNYAGSFPVVVGRQFQGRVGGSIPVVDVRRGPGRDVQAVAATSPDPSSTKPSILLGEGLVIEAAEDPGVVSDNSPATSLVVSVRDLDELLDILGPGARVLIRQ